MPKKGPGHDSRQDPDVDEASTTVDHRVDRVFAMPVSRTRSQPTSAPITSASRSSSPELGSTEIALRHELSRLQRQLADAQRDLAIKHAELADEVARRVALVETSETQEARLYELSAYQTRTVNLEKQLRDYVDVAEQLAREGTRERELRAAGDATVARVRDELASEQALRATAEADLVDLREQHEREVVELREQHERAAGTLRDELATQTLAVHQLTDRCESLVEEHADAARVLADQVGAADAQRGAAIAERDARTAELADVRVTLVSELSRATAEREDWAIKQTDDAATIDELTTTVTTLGRERGTLSNDLAETRTELARITAERNAAAAELDDTRTKLLAEVARATVERDDARTMLLTEVARATAELGDTRTTLLAEVARATAELGDTRTEVARATAERDGLAARLDEQTAMLATERAALARAEAELATLRAAMEEATLAAARARETESRLQREVTDAAEMAALFEADLSGGKVQLASATAELAALRTELETLRAELATSEAETRRTALDRAAFLAFLEEGIARLATREPAKE